MLVATPSGRWVRSHPPLRSTRLSEQISARSTCQTYSTALELEASRICNLRFKDFAKLSWAPFLSDRKSPDPPAGWLSIYPSEGARLLLCTYVCLHACMYAQVNMHDVYLSCASTTTVTESSTSGKTVSSAITSKATKNGEANLREFCVYVQRHLHRAGKRCPGDANPRDRLNV